MTTCASRAVRFGPLSPNSRNRRLEQTICVALGLLLLGGVAWAQDQSSQEILVPEHWSRYQAPTSYPEGTQLHIIVRGDTLWDLSNQYLQNPFLWPQLWDANRYIENPHLIYPGDPVMIPDLDVVRPEGVDPSQTGPGGPGGPGGGPGGLPQDPGATGTMPGGGPGGPAFYPAYEQITIQCANYYSGSEDDDFRIFGSEEGDAKALLSTGDILYLNRGSSHGVQPGDQYYSQRRESVDWGETDSIVVRTGWLTVLAVQERTAIAEITQACKAVLLDDYLKPFEPIPVPLLPRQPTATRLTPETGQKRGHIVASLDDIESLGEGYLVSIDLGERDGVVPGNMFTIFRYVYDNAPRKILGEMAILTVQERNATARILESLDVITVGDLIELK